MKILHITPSTNGYEEVTLLANRVSRTNHFAAIEKDGQMFMTGGFIIKDTPRIRKVLDAMPKEEQYEFVKEFVMQPYAKSYWEEEEAPTISVIVKRETLWGAICDFFYKR